MPPHALSTLLFGVTLALAAPTAAKADVAAGTEGGKTPSVAAEKECLALAVYWEAKGEGRKGMDAVASVVMNRVKSSEFPATVCGVVTEGGPERPCQFSWFCDGKSDTPVEAGKWAEAQQIADTHLKGRAPDPTRGATYFHAEDVEPAWSDKLQPTARIGDHEFYKDPRAD